jgi:predicted negative regulator of RcsB-dependent stress response
MTTFHGRDDVLSLLIHLGYLGYDSETKEVFIPNREILDEFKTSTKSAEWVSTFKAFERSQKLLRATWEEDAEKVAELLEEAHNRAGNKTYNDEAALSYAIQYAYYAAQKYYTTILELDTGKGYADVIFLPSPKYPELPALLIELKYNKDAKTALTQIRQQKYDERLEHYKGNLLLVSINYDKEKRNDDPEFKRHTCIIEKA